MQNWLIMLGIDILIPLLMMLFGWLLGHNTLKKNPATSKRPLQQWVGCL